MGGSLTRYCIMGAAKNGTLEQQPKHQYSGRENYF